MVLHHNILSYWSKLASRQHDPIQMPEQHHDSSTKRRTQEKQELLWWQECEATDSGNLIEPVYSWTSFNQWRQVLAHRSFRNHHGFRHHSTFFTLLAKARFIASLRFHCGQLSILDWWNPRRQGKTIGCKLSHTFTRLRKPVGTGWIS